MSTVLTEIGRGRSSRPYKEFTIEAETTPDCTDSEGVLTRLQHAADSMAHFSDAVWSLSEDGRIGVIYQTDAANASEAIELAHSILGELLIEEGLFGQFDYLSALAVDAMPYTSEDSDEGGD